MLAMEIMDTPPRQHLPLLKIQGRPPSPWFTVYPDVGNLSAWGNDTAAEISLGRNGMVGVHLKDTLAVTEDFPGKFKCVPFGSGCVDFPACLGQLEREGYRGPYMIEMWYEPSQDWRAEITNRGSLWKRSLPPR